MCRTICKLFVDKKHFAEKILKQAYNEKEKFGSTNVGEGKTVIVEFHHQILQSLFT